MDDSMSWDQNSDDTPSSSLQVYALDALDNAYEKARAQPPCIDTYKLRGKLTSPMEYPELTAHFGRASVITTTVTPFRLMDLPLELRLMIYAYSLSAPCSIPLSAPRLASDTRRLGNSNVRRTGRNIAALLCVSIALYNEATPILYSQNTFSFRTATEARLFYNSIGGAARHMTRIEVHTLRDTKTDIREFKSMLATYSKVAKLQSIRCVEFIYKTNPQPALKRLYTGALQPFLLSSAQSPAHEPSGLNILKFDMGRRPQGGGMNGGSLFSVNRHFIWQFLEDMLSKTEAAAQKAAALKEARKSTRRAAKRPNPG